jgi:teichuronic acid biosynthesis glycosyltransferase TuaH
MSNASETKKLKEKINELEKENLKLKDDYLKKEEECKYLVYHYDMELEKINFMRFARLCCRYIRNNGFLMFLWQGLRAIGKIFTTIYKKMEKKISIHKKRKELNIILKKNKNKKIMVFYPGYDWHMKMYQRPQHMAIHFSEKNVLFFYCSANYEDKIEGFEKIKDGLYATNQYEFLKANLPKFTLYLYANMNGCFKEEIKQIQEKGNDILYEYIDDLHDDLTNISKELLLRHEYILKDKSIPVVSTAQHLYNKAVKLRGSSKNILLSTNGVLYEDFHITHELPVPENISKMVKQNKPIIGYYGALAKWFDYELVEEMAKKHPDWNILLIGIDYDKSFAKYNYFKKYKNISYIGIVEYKKLINYGNCCNVLTIPFVINEITLSTSPVKVFEYMSMEKPIVTTDLPECRKYKSVMIGKTHKEFIEKVEYALTIENDEKYRKVLRNEALANTWTKKVEEILNFVSNKR